jgi:hypothetical protein
MKKLIFKMLTWRFLLGGLFGFAKRLAKFWGSVMSFEYGVIFC